MPSVAGHTRESSTARDAALAELVEGYLARLQAGEAIDPSGFAAEHPEHAERLARLLPALELMDDLRRSSIHPGSGLSLTPVLMEMPGIAPGLLGDFQIVREVGRGGMGVVYEAGRSRWIAGSRSKVLPFAAAMDPRHLQRFKPEAKAAACLHHTNIVPVHAVGCERGVHYYAMQFIEGQTLADDHRRAAGSSKGWTRSNASSRGKDRPAWPAAWRAASWPRPNRPLPPSGGRWPAGPDEGRNGRRRPGTSLPTPTPARRRQPVIRHALLDADAQPRLLPDGGRPGHPGRGGDRARPRAGQWSTATSSRPTS